jgi:hypothetical protein
MSRRIKGLFDKVFVHAVARMASATGFMAVVTYFMVTIFPLSASDQSFLASFPKFVLIVAIRGLAYVLFSHIFKLQETKPILTQAKKLLFYRVK